jgi:hypothetical protein
LRLRSALQAPLAVPSPEEIGAAAERLPPTAIPKILHQIWLGPERPPLATMASCRQMNPGWLYVLWSERNLPPMLNRRLFDAFGSTYIGKADVLRYEVLFRFGGVYVDADQLCLRSFDDLLLANDEFFAGYQHLANPALDETERGERLVANAVLGAAPRHPIVEHIIHSIADAPIVDHDSVWRAVGPAAVTRALEECGAHAVVYPFHQFYPYHFTEPIPEKPEQMLKAIHYGSHSVSLWGSTLGSYRRWRRMPGVRRGWNVAGLEVPAEFAATHPILAPTVYGG